jgi:putative hemolysin
VERLKDGSYLVDGSLSVRDLREDFGLAITEGDEYATLAGFVLSQLQTIPRGGEFFYLPKLKITIVDMDKHRVSRVKIEPVPETLPETVPAKEQPDTQRKQ